MLFQHSVDYHVILIIIIISPPHFHIVPVVHQRDLIIFLSYCVSLLLYLLISVSFPQTSFLLISSFYHAKNTVAHSFLTSFLPISVVSMSGSAMLYGLFHCRNSRYIHPSKPRMITFDCELYLGHDDESNVCIMMGVLHFFVPVNLPAPINNQPYLVCR